MEGDISDRIWDTSLLFFPITTAIGGVADGAISANGPSGRSIGKCNSKQPFAGTALLAALVSTTIACLQDCALPAYGPAILVVCKFDVIQGALITARLTVPAGGPVLRLADLPESSAYPATGLVEKADS